MTGADQGNTAAGRAAPGEATHPTSADQQAVDQYFESATYRNWMSDGRQRHPVRAWVLDLLLREQQSFSAATSFHLGLLGLAVILLVMAVLMPIEMELVESMINRNRGYVVMMMLIQFMAFPPIIAFSFATVTPMFWYGSLLKRFGAGALMVIPGCAGFYVALTSIEGSPPNDFWYGFSAVMYAQFVTAGAVALTIQMWSPWTLSHARDPGTPLPPLGTREMMELTGVAAVGCAVFVSIETNDIVAGLLFFTGVGFFTSVSVIGVLIAFLRESNRPMLAAAISGIGAFATAFLLCSFFAIAEFGWDAVLYNLVIMAFVSLWGALIIFAVMWLCLWWLRSCGWRCVSREEERRTIAATTPSRPR